MSRSTDPVHISYEPDREITDQMLDGRSNGKLPQLPDEVEARCWLLIEREDMPQEKIAAQLGMTQSGVSRAYARGKAKIEDFIARGLISLERLELELRRGVGLAPRT